MPFSTFASLDIMCTGTADSADLLVLGAWYGKGAKSGLLSIFLMCAWDKRVPAGHPGQFKTVVKVGNGLDDATLEKLNRKFATLMVPTHGKAPLMSAISRTRSSSTRCGRTYGK